MSEAFEPITTALRKDGAHAAPASEADTSDAAHRQAREAGFSPGINTEPGHDDDGWHAPPSVTLGDGTRLQLYKDGEALAAAIEAIEHARRRIFLEVYIWPSDETGRKFAALLSQKAREGVAVYAIFDSFGSFLADGSIFDAMRRAGVRLIEFHPMQAWKSRYSWRPGNRDHRKLLVVDDQIAGVGGLNIGNRYAGTWVAKLKHVDPATLWRDAAVGIVGPGAQQFARSFIRTWHYCLHRGPIARTLWFEGLTLDRAPKGRRIGKVRQGPFGQHPHPIPGVYPEHIFEPGVDLACMAGAPTLSSPLRPFLFRLIRDARRSITMTMAYFAPDDELVGVLCDAAQRGVKVRLMFAAKSDARPLIWAARSFYERLMCAGCRVYEREGALLHQKSIVIDTNVSVLGSTNLDYRSIEFNLELSAVVRSPEFARQLEVLFEHDVRFARRIDEHEWRRRPFLDRGVQWAVNRMRYIL